MTTSSLSQASPARGWIPTLATTAWISSVLLVLIGSIVRVSGHGLGCPDWPLCYGRAIPPGLTGAWVEFSHRLFGGITAAQVVLLAALIWRQESDRRWLTRPMLLAVGLLAVQVLLGGLHVVLEIPPETGLVHTAVAMLLVGTLAIVLAGSTELGAQLSQAASQASIAGQQHVHGASRQTSLGGRLPGIVATTTYVLLLTGSLVTRSGASLACLSFPLCGAVERASRQLIEIHMLHRLVAFVVAGLTLYLLYRIRRRSQHAVVRRFAYGIGSLLLLQFTLGILNVVLLLPAWSRVLHLTVGATFWSAMAVLWRVTRPAPARSPEPGSP